jgi:pimeloyl-ACP methyl ester carboxylesterase
MGPVFAAFLCVTGALHAASPLPTRPIGVPATIFTQRDVMVDGMRLRYIDEGQGPVIAMIPGHTGKLENYDGLVERLKSRFRILVVDFPGSGYSDKPDREYDLPFYEDTFLHFLDVMGIKRCHLVGGSLGGYLVLSLGAREPERFDRIVSWGPAACWKAAPRFASFIRFIGGKVLFWPTVKIQSTYWYSKSWPGREKSLENTFKYYHEVMSPGFMKMYWGIAAGLVGRSLLPRAAEIKQPTLLMRGEEDLGPGQKEGFPKLRDLMPHAGLVIFPGARHDLASEKPEELSRRILEFFSAPAAPAS